MSAEKRLIARDVTSDRLIADKIRVADNPWRSMKGLIGTKSLTSGEGLWFPGTNSIHMLFMSMTIDALFVGKPNAEGLRPVLAVRSDLPPWRGVVWWVSGADGCLELDAGVLARAQVKVGDLISILEV